MDSRMRAPKKRVGLNKLMKVRSASKIPEFEDNEPTDKKNLGSF